MHYNAIQPCMVSSSLHDPTWFSLYKSRCLPLAKWETRQLSFSSGLLQLILPKTTRECIALQSSSTTADIFMEASSQDDVLKMEHWQCLLHGRVNVILRMKNQVTSKVSSTHPSQEMLLMKLQTKLLYEREHERICSR